MSHLDTFISKLLSKEATIAVVGLGYVGLPLAVEKAKAGYHVVGIDVQEMKVDLINQGMNYISDVRDEELKAMVDVGRLHATSDFSRIYDVDAVTICVPTPLDEYHQPDTSYVSQSTIEVAKFLKPGMLIVLESTTYPGTTEELVKPILEKTGLICGVDFFLAYSPERVDPGNKQYNVKNTPKVVGGMTSDCTKAASALYRSITDGRVVEVSSPAVAEMEKVFENTFRNINIALVNELTLLCNRMNINVWEVIEAAQTKPYGFMAFYPGPGLGGHCIPIDPFYLSWKAREYNYQMRLIETAGDINRSMPAYVVQRITSILNEQRKSVRQSTIYLLGVAYKKDINDFRESPVLSIIDTLRSLGARVIYSDPHITSFTHHNYTYESVPVTNERLATSDITVITTDHSLFNYEQIAKEASVLFDTRNALKNHYPSTKMYYHL
ncbi:nucleotide sugar dehydrogenase [Paenibacillus sp. GCM10027629]|uniref:nucleotide sugar dehydrogenase n=1 Tax=Paenibacillus sp. GCM10027629 TaxID=3273414 RepID=UPI0036312CDA